MAAKGQRVQLHPATDAWMRGDRYGTIVRIGPKTIHVKMDRSERTLRVPKRNVLTEDGSGLAARMGGGGRHLRRWQVTKADAAACRRELSEGAWKDPGKRVRCMAEHAQKRRSRA